MEEGEKKTGLKGENVIMWRGGCAVVTASGRTNQGADHRGRRRTEGRRCEVKSPSDLVTTQGASHHLRNLVLDF